MYSFMALYCIDVLAIVPFAMFLLLILGLICFKTFFILFIFPASKVVIKSSTNSVRFWMHWIFTRLTFFLLFSQKETIKRIVVRNVRLPGFQVRLLIINPWNCSLEKLIMLYPRARSYSGSHQPRHDNCRVMPCGKKITERVPSTVATKIITFFVAWLVGFNNSKRID